jgi:hypothetical protein
MADNDPIEIPVVLKTPAASDGSPFGIQRFASSVGRAFSTIRSHPFVIGAILLVRGISAAVSAWREQDDASQRLNQTLVNQGIYTRELSDEYQEMAKALSLETEYADEEIVAAEASMQAYMGGQKISRELLRAVVDFAAANDMDLRRAADLIGRSIGTGTNGLMRYGLSLESAITPGEKTAAVIRFVNGRWEGQAAAAAQGLGAIRQMQNALRGVVEVIGRMLEPFVVMAAKAIRDFARSLADSGKLADAITMAFQGLQIGIELVKHSVQAAFESVSLIFRSKLAEAIKIMNGNFSGLKGPAGLQSAENEAIQRIVREHKQAFLRQTKAILAAQGESQQHAQAKKESVLEEAVQLRKEARGRANQKLDEIFRARGEKELVEERARQMLRNDAAFIRVERNIQHEKDKTRRLALELQKRRIKEEALRKAAVSFHEKSNFIAALSDKETLALNRPVLEQLSEARNSKFGPQVLIGKGAAVAQIALNTTLAISGATEALLAIPPPVGEALAAATGQFLAMYGAEQIENIVNSSIDFPGRIGGIPFNFQGVLESVWGYLGRQIEQVGRLVSEVYGLTGDLSRTVGHGIQDALTKIGPIGDVLGAYAGALGDIYGAVYDVAATIVANVYGTIGGIIGDAVELIAGTVAGIVEGIAGAVGGALDAAFGWLFAEGGVVTYSAQQRRSLVTPLKGSGLQLRRTVNVTINGGLVPSPAEARRIAGLIAQELSKNG